MRESPGFNLVELMVVVALLGIVATLASVQYQKFQSKVRQIEAKTALSAIYQLEKLSFMEHGGYSRCLSQLGYEPLLAAPGVAQGYYARGFMGGSTGAEDVLNCQSSEVTAWSASKFAGASAPASDSALLNDSCCDGGFVAEAAGSISSSTPALDRWTIDAAQRLINSDPNL